MESSDQTQLLAVGRKAEPWKAKRRRRGVEKDSLVQSRLENFVKLYPNLSIRGGLVKKCESKDGVSGGVRRGVKRGIMEVESETRRPENNSYGKENTIKLLDRPVYIVVSFDILVRQLPITNVMN